MMKVVGTLSIGLFLAAGTGCSIKNSSVPVATVSQKSSNLNRLPKPISAEAKKMLEDSEILDCESSLLDKKVKNAKPVIKKVKMRWHTKGKNQMRVVDSNPHVETQVIASAGNLFLNFKPLSQEAGSILGSGNATPHLHASVKNDNLEASLRCTHKPEIPDSENTAELSPVPVLHCAINLDKEFQKLDLKLDAMGELLIQDNNDHKMIAQVADHAISIGFTYKISGEQVTLEIKNTARSIDFTSHKTHLLCNHDQKVIDDFTKGSSVEETKKTQPTEGEETTSLSSENVE